MRSLIINGLGPGLPERGKIKIGEKGNVVKSGAGKQFQMPKKLDHFRIVTLDRGPDGNYIADREVHAIYGHHPRELPVRLLYDEIDLNYQSRYVCFTGRHLWCQGDGETAERRGNDGLISEVQCPCGRQDPLYTGNDPCKISARLSVMIDGVDRVGGVWVFRTTSYNSALGILSSLALIKRLTGGPLAGLPLILSVAPKNAVTPKTGQMTTIWVVGLEFKGSVDRLQEIGLQRAQANALHAARIVQIEQDARRLLTHDPIRLSGEEDAYVDEFAPDQAVIAEENGHAPGFNNRLDNGHVQSPRAGSASRRNSDGAAQGSGGGIDPGRETPHVGGDAGNSRPDAATGTPENDKPVPAPGAEPVAPAGNQVADPGVVPAGRRRRQRFDIAEPLRPQFSGGTQIHTCGVSPEQLLALRERMADPVVKAAVTAKLKEIGYKELGFLRADEAEALLAEPSTNAPTHAALPDDLVECPTTGDSMSAGLYCLAGKCQDRNRTGYCPAVDVDLPVDAAPVDPVIPPAPITDAPMLQLAALIDRQDWSYQRSEDPGVVARGRDIQRQIDAIYRRLDPEEKRRADEMIRRHAV